MSLKFPQIYFRFYRMFHGTRNFYGKSKPKNQRGKDSKPAHQIQVAEDKNTLLGHIGNRNGGSWTIVTAMAEKAIM